MNNRQAYLWLAGSARAEDAELSDGQFICRVGKGGICGVCACAILFTVFSVTGLVQQVLEVSAFFALLEITAWFLFVYGLTYRCHVTGEFLEESYFLLFFRKKKEVRWKDIQYRAVKRDQYGHILYLRFYNGQNRKMISFDYGMVGIERIARMAKRKMIPKRQ